MGGREAFIWSLLVEPLGARSGSALSLCAFPPRLGLDMVLNLQEGSGLGPKGRAASSKVGLQPCRRCHRMSSLYETTAPKLMRMRRATLECTDDWTLTHRNRRWKVERKGLKLLRINAFAPQNERIPDYYVGPLPDPPSQLPV